MVWVYVVVLFLDNGFQVHAPNVVFTKEERAKLNMTLADKVASFAEKTLSENTIRSKSRRLIAYVIILAWVLAAFLDIWIDNIDLTYLWKESALKTAFIMVLAFFFGGYYMKQIEINKKKD